MSNHRKLIAELLGVEESSVHSMIQLKTGITNTTIQFTTNSQTYLLRIPGAGTDRLVDRKQEYEVYQAIKELDIADSVIYHNPETGIRITAYWEGAKVCDPNNFADVKKCMAKLREFHQSNLQVSHHFSLYEQLEKYENLRNGAHSRYPDYKATKEKIDALKSFLDVQPKKITLCHVDAVPDNFLLIGEDVYIIDWEYAGMHDPHLDLAMFAIYSNYSKDQADQLMDCYFNKPCCPKIRTKIYAYMAVSGLLWSNWCEYKQTDLSLEPYCTRQYTYAKTYVELVNEQINKEASHA